MLLTYYVAQFKFWTFSDALKKLRKETINFVMSVRPSAWNNLGPTGGIFVKFDIWRYFLFSETCRENSSFVTIWQECQVIYTKINTHFESHLAQSFLNSEMFHTTFQSKSKYTFHIPWLFTKIVPFMTQSNVGKYVTAKQVTDDNMVHALCILHT
jgi:hypothetical protein